MTNNKNLAKKIVDLVGGKENISSISHCMTRLRFSLKEDKKANLAELKNLDGVVKALFSAGLLQIVIGVNVAEVYEDVSKLTESSENQCEACKEKQKPFARFISTITGVFAPVLGMLSATGLIKGMIMIFVATGILSEESGTYKILYNAADALFYFFPIVIGYTSAKKFGLNEITGIMLGLALCSPAIVNIAPSAVSVATGSAVKAVGNVFGMKYYTTILHIPVIFPASGNYTSSVVPIILIVYFASIVEKALKKVVPKEIKSFAVPLISFLLSLVAGLVILGPIATIFTDAIGEFTKFIFVHFPILGGAFVGGFWQVLVIFGLHWSLVPMHFINLASKGFDMVMSPYFAASFACLAATLAVVVKTRDKHIKSLAIPALISAVVGITEPALYGITLPKKRAFVFSCIGSALGGVVISATKSYMYISSGLGVFGFPAFMMTRKYAESNAVALNVAGGVFWAAVAVLIAMLSTFLLTFFFYRPQALCEKDLTTSSSPSRRGENKKIIVAAVAGKVKMLSDIDDPAFSDDSLGKGLAIEIEDSTIYSPVDGVIAVLPETCHAVCVVSDEGAMVLIHIGYNTAELGGKGFKAYVKEGERVKKGDKIISLDLEGIRAQGYSLTTPIIIGNSEEYKAVTLLHSTGERVKSGESIIELD